MKNGFGSQSDLINTQSQHLQKKMIQIQYFNWYLKMRVNAGHSILLGSPIMNSSWSE